MNPQKNRIKLKKRDCEREVKNWRNSIYWHWSLNAVQGLKCKDKYWILGHLPKYLNIDRDSEFTVCKQFLGRYMILCAWLQHSKLASEWFYNASPYRPITQIRRTISVAGEVDRELKCATSSNVISSGLIHICSDSRCAPFNTRLLLFFSHVVFMLHVAWELHVTLRYNNNMHARAALLYVGS